MTQTQQPEALRLAHTLSGGKLIDDSTEWADTLHAAAAELRHQHARIAELEEQLSAIGAIGAIGVEPLRKQAVQAEVPEAIEQMAVDRYKVVPSHESMFHRWAVVAGNGTQQLYLGREVECENMARKFAGAFLDGAFYQANITLPYDIARTAGSIRINGVTYIVATHEEGQPLVRQDVLVAEAKAKKEGEKQ